MRAPLKLPQQGSLVGAAKKPEQLPSANTKAWQQYVAAGPASTRNSLHSYLHPNVAIPLPAGNRHRVQPQHVYCASGSPDPNPRANPLTHWPQAQRPPDYAHPPHNSQRSQTPHARSKRPAEHHQASHPQCSCAPARNFGGPGITAVRMGLPATSHSALAVSTAAAAAARLGQPPQQVTEPWQCLLPALVPG